MNWEWVDPLSLHPIGVIGASFTDAEGDQRRRGADGEGGAERVGKVNGNNILKLRVANSSLSVILTDLVKLFVYSFYL